nr:MAG TPA: Protein of unknown function (DUF3102) [Caudoviricetes sp.]
MNELVEKKSPAVLAAEIRALTASMLSTIIEIGRRMCQAKEMLPHGEFGAWVKDETGYSQSTANNFMRLFQEYGAAQESLFGAEVNSQTFGNLPYSKALALLAVPAEEREEFARERHVEDMSTRELKQAIKERDELRRQLNEERTAAEGASLRISDMEEKLEAMKNAPVEVAIQAADPEEVQRAVDEALQKARAAHREELEAVAEEAKKANEERDKLKKQLKQVLQKAEAAPESANDGAAQREVERLKKELAMADPVVAEFKGLFEQASGLVAKLLGLVDCAPKDKQGNLRNALAALGKQMVV